MKINDINEGYGRYYCSTDKKWKTRKGPKQTRKVAEGFKNNYSVGDRVDGPLGTGTIVAISSNINADGRVKVKLDDPSRAGEDGKYKDSFVLDTTQLMHINDEGVDEAYDHNAPFNAADFNRHMDQLRAREELRKTDPMKALVGDLIDKDREKEALAKRKKPEDDSMSTSDPRHPQYSYTQAGQTNVGEGAGDTIYPNAEVIKSRNGKPVGEIYQDASGWGCFHYKADNGADSIETREEALEWLKDIAEEYRQDRNLREGSVERKQNALWAQITAHEKAAAKSKDLKKQHHLKMADQLRSQLKTSDNELKELAIDKEPNGDSRSKLIGSIAQLLKAKKKVDFYVPGIRGHVAGIGGQGDWLTLKRWNKPYSRISYSLALDSSDDSRFALKMVKPDYYQVVEKGNLEESWKDKIMAAAVAAGAAVAPNTSHGIAGAFPTPSHQAAMYKAAADSNAAQARADAAAKAKADAKRLQQGTQDVERLNKVNYHGSNSPKPTNATWDGDSDFLDLDGTQYAKASRMPISGDVPSDLTLVSTKEGRQVYLWTRRSLKGVKGHYFYPAEKPNTINEFAPGNGDDKPTAEYEVYQCQLDDQFEWISGPLYQSDNMGKVHSFAYDMWKKHPDKCFMIWQERSQGSRGGYGPVGSVLAPSTEVDESKDPCWDNYKQVGIKDKNGKKVPNCVPESLEETYDGDAFFEAYGELWYNEDEQLDEAEYHGRSVPLGKPMQGDVKKFKVYVKDPSTGNVKKVNFGDPDMKIRKSNPAARRSFRARHNCDNPGPRTKARYWSCRKW